MLFYTTSYIALLYFRSRLTYIVVAQKRPRPIMSDANLPRLNGSSFVLYIQAQSQLREDLARVPERMNLERHCQKGHEMSVKNLPRLPVKFGARQQLVTSKIFCTTSIGLYYLNSRTRTHQLHARKVFRRAKPVLSIGTCAELPQTPWHPPEIQVASYRYNLHHPAHSSS